MPFYIVDIASGCGIAGAADGTKEHKSRTEHTDRNTNRKHKENIMAIRGADIEQLKGLATKLEVNWAGQLDQLISTVDAAVQASANNVWLGPDADQFRTVIWPEHKKHMQAARQALADAGATAKRNAGAQENTSSNLA